MVAEENVINLQCPTVMPSVEPRVEPDDSKRPGQYDVGSVNCIVNVNGISWIEVVSVTGQTSRTQDQQNNSVANLLESEVSEWGLRRHPNPLDTARRVVVPANKLNGLPGHSAPTCTINFPLFDPSKSFFNARGAFSSPSTTSPRYFSLPCISHPIISVNASWARLE